MNKKEFLRVIVGAVLIIVVASLALPVRDYMRARADDNVASNDDTDITSGNGNEQDSDGINDDSIENDSDTAEDEDVSSDTLDNTETEDEENNETEGADEAPNPSTPVPSVAPTPVTAEEAPETVEVFDIAELKSIAHMEYDNNYSQISNFSTNVHQMIDDLIETAVDNKLYDEPTDLDLIYRAREDGNYVMVLLQRAYNKVYNEKMSPDLTLADQGTTSGTGSDITDYQNYDSTFNDDDLVPGYIKNISKDVKAEEAVIANETVDKFREYSVTLGMDINASYATSQVSKVDNVLLIDNSNSMSNNLENAKSAAKKLVDSIFIPTYNYNDPDSAKVAVIVFSDSAQVAIGLTSDREELIRTIDNITLKPNTDNGIDGTNIQAAVLEAKELLNMDDKSSSVSSDRNKNLIVLSDGLVTSRTTDTWVFDNSIFGQASINTNDSDIPQSGSKRWSHLIPRNWQHGELILEEIGLAGESFLAIDEQAGNDNTYKNQVDFNNLVTGLEAQFAVKQGLNIYAIDYSDNYLAESLMQSITKKLNNNPNFTNNIETKSLNTLSSEGGSKYYKSVNSNGLIDEIVSLNTKKVSNSFDGFQINEQLRNEFELDKNSIVISAKPFGEEPITGWGSTSGSSKSSIKFTTPKELIEGTYYLTYKLNVKQDLTLFPDGADKTLYGAEALDKQTFTTVSELLFKEVDGQAINLNFESPTVSIQPNLKIDFTTPEDNILLGENGVVNPSIIKGSGFYTYELKENYKNQQMVSIKKDENLKPEQAYNIELDEMSFDYEADGNYDYFLEVTDLVSNQKQTEQISINVIDPVLKINIVDQNSGSSLGGIFETRLNMTDVEGNTGVFYMSGLGSRTFTYKNGSTDLKRGSIFDINTYVPFGYKVYDVSDTDGDSDGKVTIDLVKDENGQVTGYSHEMTVRIQKEKDTKYFFDWSWFFKGENGSMSKS